MIIISLEVGLNVQYHIIKAPEDKGMYTWKTGSLTNAQEKNTVMSCVSNRNYIGLTNFFKDKFGLQHDAITYTYGPALRTYIKKQNAKGRN